MDEKDKKEYELAILVKNEEDVAPVVAFVRQHNAEITAEPRAKKLALAYEIKKNKEGVFAYLRFKLAPEEAKNLEHDLNMKSDILRFLIIASPAPAMEIGERPAMPPATKRRPRVARPGVAAGTDAKPSAPRPLSNEALEKKIEEILQ